MLASGRDPKKEEAAGGQGEEAAEDAGFLRSPLEQGQGGGSTQPQGESPGIRCSVVYDGSLSVTRGKNLAVAKIRNKKSKEEREK